MKFFLYGLLAWFLYQLIFKFIVPVYRTTRTLKKGFREMQEKMNGQFQQQEQPQQQASSTPQTRPSADDYIEFEEVK